MASSARVIPGVGTVPDERNPDTDTKSNSRPGPGDVRGGGYKDAQSEYEFAGGSATSRLRWQKNDEGPEGNGAAPRDRGHRAV